VSSSEENIRFVRVLRAFTGVPLARGPGETCLWGFRYNSRRDRNPRMKRFVRRTLAIIIGGSLGLYCAGLYNESREQRALAQDGHAPAATQPASAEHGTETHGHKAEPAGGHAGDHGTHSAAGGGHDAHGHDNAAHDAAVQLVPDTDDVKWYRPVVLTIIAFFVAAVALGYTALKIRGPLPPDPADTHDDHGHDDHAHDAHGHDAHGHKADDKGHGHH